MSRLKTVERVIQTPDATATLTRFDAPRFAVRHYTVSEVAQLWNLSDDTVRSLFEREPGVLVIGDARSNGRKRRYITVRIPADVAERVYQRLQRAP